MSDNIISSFIQLSSAVEGKNPASISQDVPSQGADFNRVINAIPEYLREEAALRGSEFPQR